MQQLLGGTMVWNQKRKMLWQQVAPAARTRVLDDAHFKDSAKPPSIQRSGCPRSELAQSLGADRDASGAIMVDAHQCATVYGLYAAGGVVHRQDQIVVAMSHAAVAATDIHNHCPPNH